MREPITILLADDHTMVRETLRRRLDEETDLRVVSTVGDAEQAVAESLRLGPDVVLLDIDMPGMTCFQAARTIQELRPDTRVVFLSAFLQDRYVEQAIGMRAWGYIVKTESDKDLVNAIRRVASGARYFSPDVHARIIVDEGPLRLASTAASRVSTLTDREVEVLRHVARGLSQKEIAKTMRISPSTVHRHTDSLMAKLDIHDRVSLARFAIREGIAEP